MDKDYLVMGEWAIERTTGRLRHKLCRHWCEKFNYDSTKTVKTHKCDVRDEGYDEPDPYQERHIPAIVRDTARTLQSANEERFRSVNLTNALPGPKTH